MNPKYILFPFHINYIMNIININDVRKYVKTDIDANKYYFDDMNLTYTISNPKKAEWIISKSILNSKIVGNGNGNFDVMLSFNNYNIYIDVGVLILNDKYTNEKSIIQNFSDTNNLDLLFINKKGSEAIDIFKNKLLDKYNAYRSDNKYYYLLFVCIKKEIYLVCLRFNSQNIKNMKFGSFVGNINTKKDFKNIIIDNFIGENNGNVKLYKSKKRLELRLNKEILNTTCAINVYSEPD